MAQNMLDCIYNGQLLLGAIVLLIHLILAVSVAALLISSGQSCKGET